MIQLVYVLPAHNEETVLVKNIERVAAYLEKFPGGAILVVENGSRDKTWEVADETARTWKEAHPASTVDVRAFREPNAGIGYAYHRGLSEALALFGPSKTRWAVLTAVDLPFGFTDLEAAMVPFEQGRARMIVGSKAHKDSQITNPATRRAMTLAYRIMRRLVLGMRVGDSQGSIFLRLDLAEVLVPRIESRGFFYGTELCHHAEIEGENVVEVPIVVEGEQRASTVRPWKHGTEMARQLFELRKRTKR